MKITPDQISVVVQGGVSKEFTPSCLKSIRKHLPQATIILSTWEGSNVGGLDFDELVLSPDPGAIARMYAPERNIGDNPNNINRQIVSTLAGLKKVKTKYALKTRTDFFMEKGSFVKYFDKFDKRTEEMAVFKQRVLSVLGNRSSHRPFFPFDFLFFGLTEDLIYLFDIPLMSKSDAEYFNDHEPRNLENWMFTQGLFKYIPEQHIWMHCLSKKYSGVFDMMKDCSDKTEENIIVSDKAFANNFVCLGFNEYGIYPMKKSLEWVVKEDSFFMLFFYEWKKLYQKYCDPTFKVKRSFMERLPKCESTGKLKKHLRRFERSGNPVFLLKCGVDLIRIFCSQIFEK